MAMNKPLLIAFLLIGFSFSLQAKPGPDSLTLLYKKWQIEQLRTIQRHLKLEEYEKAAFWSLYNSYAETIEYLEIDHLRIIELYTYHSNQLTAGKKKMLATYLLKNDFMLARIRKQYFKKFQRAFSPSVAIEIMQLDHSLRTVFRLNLQKNNPFVARATALVFPPVIQ